MALRQCVILVGGLGTRLGALTRDTPKPLVDVAGRPFLSWLLDGVARHGFEEALLLSGYRAEQFESLIPSAAAEGLRIVHSVEPAPAGTAGALSYARDLLDEAFLLMNGDGLFDFNLLDLARPGAPDALARLALRRVPDVSRYGSVEVAGERLVNFREKQAGAGAGLINGGVYWMRREILDRIDKDPCSLEQDVFPALAAAGRLEARVYEGPFIDIGLPDSFAEAQTYVPAAARKGAVFFDRDGVLNRDIGYAHRPDQLEWTPDAVEAVKQVNDAGLYAFVVTNQAGVGRGFYDEAQVKAFHTHMQAELRREGAHFDAFAYCPHHPEATLEAYRQVCRRRKPEPGMIEDLMAAWPVETARSFLIGDRDTDLQAAAAAGLPGVLYEGGSLAALVRRELDLRGLSRTGG